MFCFLVAAGEGVSCLFGGEIQQCVKVRFPEPCEPEAI